MSERLIDVVPDLVRGQKRDGRCVYDRLAKRELVQRYQQAGVSVTAMASPTRCGALRRACQCWSEKSRRVAIGDTSMFGSSRQ